MRQFLTYAPILIVLASAGGERNSDTPTAPSTPAFQASITAEPLSVRPEFLPSHDCTGRPPFGVRVVIIMRGPDIVLRGLSFQFIDLVGTRTAPVVIPLPTPSTAVSSLPSASPVPVPGIAALPPMPSSAPMPFLAQFGCGVIPDGILIITARSDRGTSEMRVVVADH